MRGKSFFTSGLLALVVLVPATSLLQAGTPHEAEDGTFYELILAIIEDPDPVPVIIWEPARDAVTGEALHIQDPTGGDGRPDVVSFVDTGAPLVTWADKAGLDHDIAVAEWTGRTWTDTEFLTSGTADELDPRAHLDSAGRGYVVWWQEGSVQRIYLSTREPGAPRWGPPQLIPWNGRRPSVVRVGSETVIAFERDLICGGQEVAVGYLDDLGGMTLETVATTDRTERLDPVVHHAAGKLWVDWKHSAGTFAYSVREAGRWSAPVTLPWTDPSWQGEQDLRGIIQQRVTNP